MYFIKYCIIQNTMLSGSMLLTRQVPIMYVSIVCSMYEFWVEIDILHSNAHYVRLSTKCNHTYFTNIFCCHVLHNLTCFTGENDLHSHQLGRGCLNHFSWPFCEKRGWQFKSQDGQINPILNVLYLSILRFEPSAPFSNNFFCLVYS